MTEEKFAELERIRLAHPKKLLVAAEVVEAAKDEASPLHGDFTWDDSEAAGLYREQQARQVIRAAVVFEPRLQRSTRAYLSVPTDRTNEGGYRRTSEVLDRPDYVAQLVEEVQNKVRSMRSAYSHLSALDPLWIQFEETIAKFLSQRLTMAA